MYKALYFKPKYRIGTYNAFIDRFIDDFKLDKIKNDNSKYILENTNMLVKVEPKIASVYIYDDSNLDEIKRIKNYFYEC